MTATNDKKRKRIEQGLDNPIEAVRDLASNVTSGAASIPGDLAENAFQQIFGTPQTPTSGDLMANQDLELNRIEKRNEVLAFQKQRESVEQNVFSYKETIAIKQEMQELLKQLKLLAQSTQSLSTEVAVAAMAEMPVNPGTYHVNFFEWLIKMIKSLRESVEDSRSWLGAFQSRKGQKQYWNMFKKHGTSFGLSNERVIATQAG